MPPLSARSCGQSTGPAHHILGSVKIVRIRGSVLVFHSASRRNRRRGVRPTVCRDPSMTCSFSHLTVIGGPWHSNRPQSGSLPHDCYSECFLKVRYSRPYIVGPDDTTDRSFMNTIGGSSVIPRPSTVPVISLIVIHSN